MAVKRLNNAEREAIRNKLLAPTWKEVNEVRKNIKDEISSFIQGKVPDEVIKFHEKYPGLIQKESEWYGPRDFSILKVIGRDYLNVKKSRGCMSNRLTFLTYHTGMILRENQKQISSSL